MPIQNCEQLRAKLDLAKAYKDAFNNDFDKAIESQNLSILTVLQRPMQYAIDEMRRFFFDPEKIRGQLIQAVFLSREAKNKEAGIAVSDADEWFESNVILKPETREVIYKNEHFHVDGFSDFELPENMTILGDVLVRAPSMSKLPKGLRVVGSMILAGTGLKDLPDDMEIEGSLTIRIDKHLLKKAKKLAKKNQIWGKVEYIK